MVSTLERLTKKSTTIVKIMEEGETEPYEFKIQRLSTFELIESQEMSETVGDEDADIEKMDENKKMSLKQLKTGVFPLMKRFIPICVLEPIIIFEGKVEDPTTTIHQRSIPMPVLSELFNQILKFSGLDKESMDKIKKKEQVIKGKGRKK